MKPVSFLFGAQHVLWGHVSCFAEVQVDYTSSSSLIHQFSYSIVEGHQINQARFELGEAMMVFPDLLPVIYML